jgi:hypothetical protein
MRGRLRWEGSTRPGTRGKIEEIGFPRPRRSVRRQLDWTDHHNNPVEEVFKNRVLADAFDLSLDEPDVGRRREPKSDRSPFVVRDHPLAKRRDPPWTQEFLEFFHQPLLEMIVGRVVLERDDERETRRRLVHSFNDG